MCIAIPVEIVAIADAAKQVVRVVGRDGRTEDVSAALVAEAGSDGNDLLGRWALTHAGFVLSLIDAEEARSRLAVFAAMSGLAVEDADLRPEV